MAESWHTRRLAKYCILCLWGADKEQVRISVNAYDTDHAYKLAREKGYTPIGVWSVN